MPRGTSQLRIEAGGTTMRLDPADDDTVDSLDRPIGYWVQDHSSDAPYLSLRADDTFRLFDGCVTRTGTWRWSHTEQVRLYTEAQTGEFCADADPDLRRSTRGRVDGDTIALSRTDGSATGTLRRYAG
ncbi:hypothetical protein SAMN02800687_1848 [Curtobacterium sp. UNCCL20]|uniref:hypothetical protein n=1 Tax=Curtobacterium sp. UNCCL20 TaxID=1502773 RepID=UPI0008889F7E|nr:hypothetical protein [Curtobacterium sp. UNCCL20]SDQ42969.1 hypothetical protein SAMN02800687_1848 [Curtobacterium sp. UNCCL20]